MISGVACGYFSTNNTTNMNIQLDNGTNLTEGGFCVSRDDCGDEYGNFSYGHKTTYFGEFAFLFCGAIKNGVALGLSVILGYIAFWEYQKINKKDINV